MKINQKHEVFIRSGSDLEDQLRLQQSLKGCTLQGIDMSGTNIRWDQTDVEGLTLIGCTLPDWLESYLRKKGCSDISPTGRASL